MLIYVQKNMTSWQLNEDDKKGIILFFRKIISHFPQKNIIFITLFYYVCPEN